jgi:hypothetical protein
MISGIKDIFKKTSLKAIEIISEELNLDKFERMSISPGKENR